MEREELLRRLAGIEGGDFEVKAAACGVPDDAYKTVSAFANTDGGWLVFGVSERRGAFAVTGVTDPDGMQNDFVTACRSPTKFSRPVDVVPRLLMVDGAAVLCFRVPRATRFDKPVRVRSRKTWESYVRIGSGDHLCSPEEEGRFLRDASTESFDDQPADGSTLDDLSPRALRWFRALLADRRPERASPELDDESWLAEVGLTRDQKTPTHAAVLLFGRDRALARLKPAGILDLRFIDDVWTSDSPEHRWDDRELFEDNLVGTLRGAFERLTRRLPQPFSLDVESGRSAARSADFVPIRESLVNLLIHQDYADRNRTARVLWYRDRVIFENPGDSYISVASMLDGGVSQLRNPLLARLIRQVGFAEQAGTGIMAIVRAWRVARRLPPQIENDPGRKQFTLTLPWGPLLTPAASQWLERHRVGRDEDAGRLLALAQAQPILTWAQARLVTGMAAHRLAPLIARLVAAGRLAAVEAHPEEAWRLVHGDAGSVDGGSADSGSADSGSADSGLADSGSADSGSADSGSADSGSADSGSADSGSPALPLNPAPALSPAKLSPRAVELYAVIAAQPGSRVPELVKKTGWSAASVKRAIAALRAAAVIRFEGSPRSGGYRVAQPPSFRAST